MSFFSPHNMTCSWIVKYQITLHMKSGIVWISLTQTFTLTILILPRCTNMKWQQQQQKSMWACLTPLRSWCLKVSLPICTGHYFLQLVLTMLHPTSTWMWCGSVSKSSCQMPTERSHVSCHPSPPCPSTIKVRAGIIIITVPVRLSPRWSEWKKVEHEFHFEHFPY